MGDAAISDAVHVARKQHHCDLCHRHIAPGEKYRRQRAVWEGEIGVWRAHVECDTAAGERHANNDWNWNEPLSLEDWDSDDEKNWLLEAHPIVAQRLGFVEVSP